MSELNVIPGPYTTGPTSVKCGSESEFRHKYLPTGSLEGHFLEQISNTVTLMAASLEMYAELQKQLTHWEVIWGASLDRDLAKHAKQEALRIRALLAKARGETP